MNVTRPDINHVVGDILTSSQHCLNTGTRCCSQNEGKPKSCWSARISRIWFWHSPKLQLWFHIYSTEITSRISLPLSNGEAEVNDQKKKFLFFCFWKKKKKKKLDAKLAKESTMDNWSLTAFSLCSRQDHVRWKEADFTINYCLSSFKCQYYFPLLFPSLHTDK